MTRGVVTLCDDNYFPGLLRLHESIATSAPYPIACFDVGFTAEQRSTLRALSDVEVLPLPDDPLIARIVEATRDVQPLAKPGKRIWPLWICPILIRASPFDETVWLDTDLVVLEPLDRLYGELDSGPVFTPENKAPERTPNAARLYELLPIERVFDPTRPCVNAGVSAWRRGRDDYVLSAYTRPVSEAAERPEVREAISWHDQGALIWAIQALGLEQSVQPTWRWNLAVDNASLADDALRWDDDLVPRLREHLPGVGILHWNGRRPAWQEAAPA
ncbi:MAG: hypothetical protein ACXVRZ_18060 [Gaiellaceae bacterium]